MDNLSESKAAYCIEFFHAKPHYREKLKEALLELGKQSKQEEGCLQYDILEDKSNKDLFILIVKYANAELMKKHENQPYITEFSKEKMNQFCEHVKWYDATTVKSA